MKPALMILTGLLSILGMAYALAGQGLELVVRPEARAQTAPVPHAGDAADDPAIWIHPTESEHSLILGTDKQGGLHVYNIDGSERQLVGAGCQPNNVDVLYDFKMGGNQVDLAVTDVRNAKSPGVKIWLIDPKQRSLSDATAGETIPVLGRREPYGCCTYRSARNGKAYFFVGSKTGQCEQYELADDGNGRVSARKVRAFKIGSQVEGFVADDERGVLYVGEESVGVWKLGAEPDAGDMRELVDKVGENGLKSDVEGLTLYCGRDGKGYLIVSSQGNNTFKVYDRRDHRFVLTIDPRDGKIDDVSDTDGIAVANRPTSRQFPKGLLVVQDGSNKGGKQNFKLYAWDDIAGDRLIVDTEWSPRRR